MRLGIAAALVLSWIAAAQPTVAFNNVSVVDVEKGALRRNQTVVVQGDRIIACDDTRRVHLPEAHVIDGKGKFLIPGLWDMHVHTLPSAHVAELFVASGVTGVRDMFDYPDEMRILRKAIQDGVRAGPRIVASGPALNGRLDWDHQVLVRTAKRAREVVRQQKMDGVEFVKVYNGLPRDAFFALADECKRLGMVFVGHTPDAVTVEEAAIAGQRSIEHLDGVLLHVSSFADQLRRSHVFEPNQRMLNTYDPGRANVLFATFVRYGTWQCPTLTMHRGAGSDDVSRAVYRKMIGITASMYRAGVPLLAGTDTGFQGCLPGAGLHDELEILTAAGVPAPAVLRIATFSPAVFLGRTKDLGTIERGKLADLVLLDADPLESITNTRRIRAVVANGRLYDRAALDRLLRPL